MDVRKSRPVDNSPDTPDISRNVVPLAVTGGFPVTLPGFKPKGQHLRLINKDWLSRIPVREASSGLLMLLLVRTGQCMSPISVGRLPENPVGGYPKSG